MTQFHVGQRVTMIKPFPVKEVRRAKEMGVSLPVPGPVYIIRTIDPGVTDPYETYLRFVEIANAPTIASGKEPLFLSSFFRPVVERKTSIEIFKAMLNKPTVRIDA